MTRQEDAAFVEFLDTYRDRLFRYLIVITRGDEELTQEAMQQTMLRVVRHIRRFDDKDVFWSWLTRLARSAVTDHTRKKGRYFAFLTRFFNHQDAQKESSTNATEDPSLLDRLEELLPSLSTEDADLVKRKYYLGETSRTIAEQLGTTEKAIESRLVRIRRRLREMLLKEAQHE